jgi:hypothetical protein
MSVNTDTIWLYNSNEMREKKISRGSQMAACYLDRLTDWTSVVRWALTWLESEGTLGEPRWKRKSTVGSSYQATASEDCNSLRELNIFYSAICKSQLDPFTNLKPACNHKNYDNIVMNVVMTSVSRQNLETMAKQSKSQNWISEVLIHCFFTYVKIWSPNSLFLHICLRHNTFYTSENTHAKMPQLGSTRLRECS